MYNCPNCGTQVQPGMNNCPNCGTQLNNNMGGNNQNYQQPNMGYQQPNNGYQQPNMGYAPNGNRPFIKKRDVAMTVILSILTCGIYGIIWFINLTDDSNNLAYSEKTASGGLSFLYIILTCGIYNFYWAYKLGKKMNEAGQRNNVSVGDNSVLYLVLSFFGLGIVVYCLAQSDINKFATNQ